MESTISCTSFVRASTPATACCLRAASAAAWAPGALKSAAATMSFLIMILPNLKSAVIADDIAQGAEHRAFAAVLTAAGAGGGQHAAGQARERQRLDPHMARPAQ